MSHGPKPLGCGDALQRNAERLSQNGTLEITKKLVTLHGSEREQGYAFSNLTHKVSFK
jgi:hypothetical protein